MNKAAQFGGAIYIEDSDLNLDGDTFIGNWANYGGAIATNGAVAVSIANTKALGNETNASTGAQGGFIYLNSGAISSLFVNSVFSGNKANGRSGVL